MAASDPITAAVAFLDTLPDSIRADLIMRLAWLAAEDDSFVMAMMDVNRTDATIRARFDETFRPSRLTSMIYTGRALMLRAFIDYEFEGNASPELEKEQEDLEAFIKERRPSLDISAFKPGMEERRNAYRSRLEDWRRLRDTELADGVIRQHVRLLSIEEAKQAKAALKSQL